MNSGNSSGEPTIKKPRLSMDEVNVKIGTHNGTFHCDEALACYLLKLLPKYKVRGLTVLWSEWFLIVYTLMWLIKCLNLLLFLFYFTIAVNPPKLLQRYSTYTAITRQSPLFIYCMIYRLHICPICYFKISLKPQPLACRGGGVHLPWLLRCKIF